MKTTKEKIEIMQAYDRGEQIQIKGSNIDWIDIIDIVSPKWDWINYDYRVKPKPKYAPFSIISNILYLNPLTTFIGLHDFNHFFGRFHTFTSFPHGAKSLAK